MQRWTTGDTIVFDSVSRMSRSADEGVEIYFELYEKGYQSCFSQRALYRYFCLC